MIATNGIFAFCSAMYDYSKRLCDSFVFFPQLCIVQQTVHSFVLTLLITQPFKLRNRGKAWLLYKFWLFSINNSTLCWVCILIVFYCRPTFRRCTVGSSATQQWIPTHVKASDHRSAADDIGFEQQPSAITGINTGRHHQPCPFMKGVVYQSFNRYSLGAYFCWLSDNSIWIRCKDWRCVVLREIDFLFKICDRFLACSTCGVKLIELVYVDTHLSVIWVKRCR